MTMNIIMALVIVPTAAVMFAGVVKLRHYGVKHPIFYILSPFLPLIVLKLNFGIIMAENGTLKNLTLVRKIWITFIFTLRELPFFIGKLCWIFKHVEDMAMKSTEIRRQYRSKQNPHPLLVFINKSLHLT